MWKLRLKNAMRKYRKQNGHKNDPDLKLQKIQKVLTKTMAA